MSRGKSVSRGVISVWAVSVQGGRVSVQGVLCQGDPLYGKERAVRILLECILVSRKSAGEVLYTNVIRSSL